MDCAESSCSTRRPRRYRPICSKPGPAIDAPAPLCQFRCKSCRNSFPTKYALARHRSHVHLKPDPKFRCILCSIQFYTQNNFSHHMKLHNDHICTFCNTGFESEINLNEHHAIMHRDQDAIYRRFLCLTCSKLYWTRNMLLRHCRKVHNHAQVQFRCGVCGVEAFIRRSDLKEHIGHCKTDNPKQSFEDAMNGFDNSNDDYMPAEFLNYNLLADDDYFDAGDLLLGHDATHPGMVEEFLEDAFQIPPYDDSILDILMEDINSGVVCEAKSSVFKNDTRMQCYKCPRCKTRSFTSQLEMNTHLAHDHLEYVLICNECGAAFNKLHDLESHRNEHKHESRLANKSLSTFFGATSGEPVQELFLSTPDTENHKSFRGGNSRKTIESQSTIHKQPSSSSNTASKKAQCITIQSTHHHTPPELSEYSKIHTEDSLCCSLCDKTFTTIAGLKYHLKTHTAVKSFRCPFCDRRFLASTNLHAHIRALHSTLKPHACVECEHRFGNAYDLRRHVSSTHRQERHFVCSVCEKRFTQQSHLTQHSWQHTGVKPFPCELCVAAYTSRTALKKHVRSVHAVSVVQTDCTQTQIVKN